MSVLSRLFGWLGGPPAPRHEPRIDPIAERLHAAVDADAKAKLDLCHSYERRVHAMIEELFFRMDRHGRR